jgi:hypothetical protein
VTDARPALDAAAYLARLQETVTQSAGAGLMSPAVRLSAGSCCVWSECGGQALVRACLAYGAQPAGIEYALSVFDAAPEARSRLLART